MRKGEQSKHCSIAEASVNVVLGIVINIAVLRVAFHAPVSMNVAVIALMTGVSFVRQYGVRRIFNRFH